MQRYFIYLAYDGTNYHGWQIQPDRITVQELFIKALSTFLRTDIEVMGAGRTDTGVHASKMVAQFDYDGDLDTDMVTTKLNRMLPRDVSVFEVRKVKPDVHARFDALSRTYKYYVTSIKNPFNRFYAARPFFSLDYAKMNEAAAVLFEYTDFTSFSKLHTAVNTNNCKIMHAAWTLQDEHTLVFTVKADRFLRTMVRAVVGT